MKKSGAIRCVGAAALLLQCAFASGQQCSDRDYATFKRYDAYLDANPNMDDSQARANFSARVGMRPADLKDLYFRCLMRWKDREPEAAQKTAQDAMARMAAGGESPVTRGHSCNTLGYRYGHTATSAMLGKQPKIGWDFSMPDRCKNIASMETGIRAGTKDAAK